MSKKGAPETKAVKARVGICLTTAGPCRPTGEIVQPVPRETGDPPSLHLQKSISVDVSVALFSPVPNVGQKKPIWGACRAVLFCCPF